MCKPKSSACLDHCCWSLQTKAQFFVFWTLLHAILGLACLFVYPIGLHNTHKWLLLAVLIMHLLSGVCMLIALLFKFCIAFMIGMVFSCVMPCVYVFTIYLPIVQIILFIGGLRFYNSGMPDG